MTSPGCRDDAEIMKLAEAAISSGKVQVIRLREAWPFVLAIEQILMKRKGLTSQIAFRAATDGLRMSCITCGEFNEEAKQAILLGGKGGFADQAKGVSFEGPIVASLAQGRCPGCQESTAMAVFHFREAQADPRPPTKPWWKFW